MQSTQQQTPLLRSMKKVSNPPLILLIIFLNLGSEPTRKRPRVWQEYDGLVY